MHTLLMMKSLHLAAASSAGCTMEQGLLLHPYGSAEHHTLANYTEKISIIHLYFTKPVAKKEQQTTKETKQNKEKLN